MHLHRILFVILGNLLKPPTHPSHLLGSTATPPHALSHSHQWQLARWQLSPAVLPGTSKQVLKSGKGCQKQPVTFLAQAWPWEQPGKEKNHKKPQKTTTPAFVVVRWLAPSSEGKNTLSGKKLLRNSRGSSLLFADTESGDYSPAYF